LRLPGTVGSGFLPLLSILRKIPIVYVKNIVNGCVEINKKHGFKTYFNFYLLRLTLSTLNFDYMFGMPGQAI
jgi:hypothetical protein